MRIQRASYICDRLIQFKHHLALFGVYQIQIQTMHETDTVYFPVLSAILDSVNIHKVVLATVSRGKSHRNGTNFMIKNTQFSTIIFSFKVLTYISLLLVPRFRLLIKTIRSLFLLRQSRVGLCGIMYPLRCNTGGYLLQKQINIKNDCQKEKVAAKTIHNDV